MIKKILNKITFHSILLLLILLVSIANRFYGLDRLSLWADELWVVMASSKGSLLDMLSFVMYSDNHPPGHYLFTRYWQMIAGDSDYAIRLPFAVAGIFLVYSTYAIGKKYYSVEAGLIAAALISSSWQAIYYSQEARANILVAVAALWSFNYLYRVAFADKINNKNLSGFWISSTLCCYLHYAGTVFVASLALVFCGLLLVRREKYCLVLGIKLFLPVVLLFSPWLPGMFYHLTHKPAGAWWGVPEWNYFYDNFAWIFWFGGKIFLLYQGAFILLVVSFLLYMVGRNKINLAVSRFVGVPEKQFFQSVQFSSVMLLMTVIPPVIFFIKSKISQPAYDYRHFIYTMPFMAMAAGFMVNLFFTHFRRWIRGVILASVVISIILVQNYSNIIGKLYLGPHFKAEYRQSVALYVQAQSVSKERDLIVANSNFYNHYLARSLNGRIVDYILANSQQVPELNELINNQKPAAIYFLEMPERGGDGMISLVDMELAKHYQPVCHTQFIYTQVIKFSIKKPVMVDWDQVPDCI